MISIKKILEKINEFIGDIITGIIMDMAFSSASPWQRFKWKIEDWFKDLFKKN